ncbi:MAG: hypothetical protein ACRBN8_30735 [Nannocystales bacterium]
MKWLQRNIFLVDGLGALISTVATATILWRLQALLGMPEGMLAVLVVLAIGFAAYSLTCWARDAPLRPWLPLVMAANLAYCGLVAGALLWHGSALTTVGMAYFAGEIGVIIGVVALEARVLRARLTTP